MVVRSPNDANQMVRISISEPSNFKSLFHILQNNDIPEVDINITQEGVEILETDSLHLIVVHIHLKSDNFYTYPLKIGVDVVNLNKSLKRVLRDIRQCDRW